jgi:glycosyltransferase involved in cell wall biosynthesis
MPTVAIDARDALAAQLRGWGRYTAELLRALEAGAANGLTVLPLQGGRGPEVLWEQVSLPRLLARARPAVVHAPNCFLPLRRPCPGVVTIHDLAFEEYPDDFAPRTRLKYRAFTPRAARSAQRVICDSEFTKTDVCERYGVDPGKVRVIHLAPALGVGDLTPPDPGYVLAVGDLRKKKNLAPLVRAWRHLRADGLPHRLVLAGADEGEAGSLRALADGEPLELTGYVSDEQLDALIRGADALVQPGLYEGFGLGVVEAMQRDTPVVAARAGALPETAGGAALLFDPDDEDDLARVLRGGLEDETLRADLVARGRARVTELSWARTATRTAAVYREAIGA